MGLVKELKFYCNVSVAKNNSISAKAIGFYDLTFVLKGKLTYIIDGQTYILEENDAIFLKPNTIRERSTGNSPVKYVSFNFLLNEDIDLSPFLKGVIGNDTRKLISIFPHSHISATPYSKEKLESILNYILYEIMDISSHKTQNVHITKIVKYIENNLSHNLSLTEISKEINLTKEYTANLFKKEMGKTIIEYVNERKMIVARNLIDNREYSLNNVSLSLGFDNYSYFSKVFKKYYGISPLKFKNR